MLLNANTKESVDRIPQEHQEELRTISTRMLPIEWAAMRQRIRQWANDTDRETTDFFASNWRTSNDWKHSEDGIFQPLYYACGEHFEHAGHMFGWLVRCVMIEIAGKRRMGNVQKPRSGITGTSKSDVGNVLLEG